MSILHTVQTSIDIVHLHIIISSFVSDQVNFSTWRAFHIYSRLSDISIIFFPSLYFHIRHIFFLASSLMQLWRFIILFVYTLIHSFPFSFSRFLFFIHFYDLLHVFMTLDMRIDEKEMNISEESWILYNLVFRLPSLFFYIPFIPFDLLFDGSIL